MKQPYFLRCCLLLAAIGLFFLNNTYAQPCGNNKVIVCHNGQDLCLPLPAVQAHLRHGDFLGSCHAPTCSINLGNDTLICSASGYTLTAPSGFVSYVWGNGATGQALVISSSGTFTIAATDALGCVARDTITINIFSPPVVNAGADTTISAGACVTLMSMISGGGSPFQTMWSTGSTSSSISVCPADTTMYTVMVTDANGCMDMDTVIVNVDSTICDIDLGNDTSLCSATGYTLTAPGGFASYQWDNGATGQALVVGTSGTFTLAATTGSGCIARDTIVINIFSPPTLSAGADTTIAFGACVNLVASVIGGTGPFDLTWSTGDTTAVITVCPTDTAGYTVMVTDSNGCMAMDTVVVNVDSAICVISLGNDTAVCFGDSVTITAPAGFTVYQWGNGVSGAVLTTDTSGTFTIAATNAVGCIARDTITITIAPPLVANAGADTTINAGTCGLLHGTASGGISPYSFMWNNGATTDTTTVCATSPGYILTVTDSIGCVDMDTVIVFVSDTAQTCSIGLGNDTAGCAGFLFMAPGGFTNYQWSNGASGQILTVTGTGTFTVTATNANGCEASDSISLSIFSSPTVDAGPDTIITGPGICVVLQGVPSGGTPPYHILWNSGDTIAPLIVCDTATTTHIITVTDSNGCVAMDTVMVTLDTLCHVDLGADTTVCSNTGFQLYAAGDFTIIQWSTGSTNDTIDIITSGTYSVTVTTLTGCQARDTVIVTVNPAPVADAGSDSTLSFPHCVTLMGSASGGVAPYQLIWENGDTGTFTIVCDTVDMMHILTVVGANGCVSSDTVNIIAAGGPIVCDSIEIQVCHTPAGNTDNARTICIDSTTLAEHLAHGDVEGPCANGFLTQKPGLLIPSPNPFNNQVQLQLIMNETGPVTVEIVTLNGNLISNLYKGNVDAGIPYNMTFTPVNLIGGIYLARVISKDGLPITEKMVFIKE